MKKLWGFAQLSLVLVGSILIAGPVSATGIRDHHDRGEFDFSFLNKNGQFRNKITGAVARSAWLEDLEGQIGKGGEYRFSEHSIFGKLEDYSDGKINRHDGSLKFLFGSSGGKQYEERFKAFFENNPRYADYLVKFDGAEHGLGHIAQKIVSDSQSVGASVVPIPAAAWLMFSALSVLAWRGKKSGDKKNSAASLADAPGAIAGKQMCNTN
jgi:hypothetical protein